MLKKVVIMNEIKEGCEIIRGSHKFAPNVTVTGIIPVGTKEASPEAKKAAATAYAAQLDSYKPEEFDALNGKTVWGGYIIRTILGKKLKSLGFEVLTQPQKKIDRWGEGQPRGYEKYFKGGYAAQIICGSLEESGLVSRDNGLENMFQINCEIRNKTEALGTGYIYVRAGSSSEGKKIIEIFFSEYYDTDIEVSTKTELVEHPGIWAIKDTAAARKAVAAAKKNNGVLYTKAAAAELQEQRKQSELAVRDERIAALEATVAKLQATVAMLLDASKPEDDPEPKDPPSEPAPVKDETEDWGDLDDISTPGYHEDSMMTPNAKQETPVVTPKSEEPLFHEEEENVEEQDAPEDDPEPEPKDPKLAPAEDEEEWDLDDITTPGYNEDTLMNPNAKPSIEEPVQENSNDKEQAVPEEIVQKETTPEPVKKYEINTDNIVLTPEVSELIASFLAFDDITASSKAVLDYEGALKKYEEERDRRYVLLIAHTRALGCSLEELKAAIVKKFRPQGLKISGIGVKDDKMYVRANKCGHGNLAWYEIVNDNGVKILKDSFLKLTNGVK